MNFHDLADQTSEYIIERRRYYHAHPELSNKEVNTSEAVKADLEKLGISAKKCSNCNGVYADIVGGLASASSKTVALRADMDALPVEEKTGLPFASENCGVMHACGHDNHIAMLLGAAKMLKAVQPELKGTVRLLFQPAEEVATGAHAMIADGVMDGVDAVYGAHVWGNFDAPLLDVSAGNRMACCDQFSITVNGVSAHGSAPNLGKDAIVAAAAIVMNLQSYVSRHNDPLNPLVVTVGTINGGQRFNIIANKVVLEGTVRTFSEETLKCIAADMQKIASDTADVFGATAELQYDHLTPPVINSHDDLNAIAHDAVVKLYGEAGLGELPTMMGSEDFAFFMEKAPGIYGFLGARDPEKGFVYTNHQDKFGVDEDVLKRGAALHAQFAFDYLEKNAR